MSFPRIMKSLVNYKQQLRNVVPSTVIAYAVMKREHPDFGIKDILLRSRLIKGASVENALDVFVRQSAKMYGMIDIDVKGYYVYPYDSWVGRIVHRKRKMITSVTVDYKTVLESSLKELSQNLPGDLCQYRTAEHQKEKGMLYMAFQRESYQAVSLFQIVSLDERQTVKPLRPAHHHIAHSVIMLYSGKQDIGRMAWDVLTWSWLHIMIRIWQKASLPAVLQRK